MITKGQAVRLRGLVARSAQTSRAWARRHSRVHDITARWTKQSRRARRSTHTYENWRRTMDEQIRPVNRARAPAVSRPVPKARTSARGPIMNMTANRMILLLQIYRSPDWATERRIGTFESDLQMLLLSGFIHITSGRIYETTDRGDAYIKQLLEIEP